MCNFKPAFGRDRSALTPVNQYVQNVLRQVAGPFGSTYQGTGGFKHRSTADAQHAAGTPEVLVPTELHEASM